MKKSTIKFQDSKLKNKIYEIIENYIKMWFNSSNIFKNFIIKKQLANNNTPNSQWSYYHYILNKEIWKLRFDKTVKDFINWQIIEYYLIKDIPESQLDNNVSLNKNSQTIDNYAKKEWFQKVEIDRKGIIKKIFIKFDKEWYLNVIFSQKDENWELKWFKKGIWKMINGYIWEFLYWAYLTELKKERKINDFKWSNSFNPKSKKNNDSNIEIEYDILSEWLYDFEITLPWNKKIFVDLKGLNTTDKNIEVLKNGKSSFIWKNGTPITITLQTFSKYKFYIKSDNLNKKPSSELYFVPMWYNWFKKDFFFLEINSSPSISYLKNNISNIEKYTKNVINNITKYCVDVKIWNDFPYILQKTIKWERNEVLTSTQPIKIFWKTIISPIVKTGDWITLWNIAVYYWKFVEEKSNWKKSFQKI